MIQLNWIRWFCSTFLVLFLLLSCTSCGQTPGNQPIRKWTDNSGKFSFQGQLVEIDEDQVVLKNKQGKTIRVDLNRLSQADREYLASVSKSKPVAKSNGSSKAGQSQSGLKMTASLSRKEPFDLVVFPDTMQLKPVFMKLEITGREIANSSRYGQYHFESIVDDKGKKLKLLKPLRGKFNEDLQQRLVDLDHFFLEQPDKLTHYLIIENPSPDATSVSIKGHFQLEVQPSVTIENIMSKLGRPLNEPELKPIGKFVASLPAANESDVAGSLAIDFEGNRKLIKDIEILSEKGIKESTGGFGEGSNRKARIIRWTGEKLAPKSRLRIVLDQDPKLTRVPIQITAPMPGKQGTASKVGSRRSSATSGRSGNNNASSAMKNSFPSTTKPTGKPTGNFSRDRSAKASPAPREVAIQFFKAAQQDDLETIKRLLPAYPSLIQRKDPRWQETAFSKACWNGNVKVVRYLLDQGAEVNVRAGDGITPLHQAARQGKTEVVKILLERGADVYLKSNNGDTAQNLAAKNRHIDVYRLLQSHAQK